MGNSTKGDLYTYIYTHLTGYPHVKSNQTVAIVVGQPASGYVDSSSKGFGVTRSKKHDRWIGRP